MEALASKLMTWLSIEESRRLTGMENIISQATAQEYDAKVAIGWPDTMAETLSITTL